MHHCTVRYANTWGDTCVHVRRGWWRGCRPGADAQQRFLIRRQTLEHVRPLNLTSSAISFSVTWSKQRSLNKNYWSCSRQLNLIAGRECSLVRLKLTSLLWILVLIFGWTPGRSGGFTGANRGINMLSPRRLSFWGLRPAIGNSGPINIHFKSRTNNWFWKQTIQRHCASVWLLIYLCCACCSATICLLSSALLLWNCLYNLLYFSV